MLPRTWWCASLCFSTLPRFSLSTLLPFHISFFPLSPSLFSNPRSGRTRRNSGDNLAWQRWTPLLISLRHQPQLSSWMSQPWEIEHLCLYYLSKRKNGQEWEEFFWKSMLDTFMENRATIFWWLFQIFWSIKRCSQWINRFLFGKKGNINYFWWKYLQIHGQQALS